MSDLSRKCTFCRFFSLTRPLLDAATSGELERLQLDSGPSGVGPGGPSPARHGAGPACAVHRAPKRSPNRCAVRWTVTLRYACHEQSMSIAWLHSPPTSHIADTYA